MTERPLSLSEEEQILDCMWVVNQGGLSGEATERHEALLEFYKVACPIQVEALMLTLAERSEDWDD